MTEKRFKCTYLVIKYSAKDFYAIMHEEFF